MYDDTFFASVRGPAADSSRVVVPLLMEWVRPRSVVDVGCGDGTWLAAFSAAGVADFLGVDGEYARPQLQIPGDHFQSGELSKSLAIPRKFDLAMSLEVAEHLPESTAGQFVKSLASLSPVVLFSAAIPRQRGTNHINEQPPAYWSRLFASACYRACDAIRPKIWNNESVAWWYKQNAILYAAPDWLDQHPALQPFIVDEPLHLVHPQLLAWRDDSLTDAVNPKLRAAAARLCRAMIRVFGGK